MPPISSFHILNRFVDTTNDKEEIFKKKTVLCKSASESADNALSQWMTILTTTTIMVVLVLAVVVVHKEIVLCSLPIESTFIHFLIKRDKTSNRISNKTIYKTTITPSLLDARQMLRDASQVFVNVRAEVDLKKKREIK